MQDELILSNNQTNTKTDKRQLYIESYGCAMNFSDSEIIASILQGEGFGATRNLEEADLIFLNNCFYFVYWAPRKTSIFQNRS
jgi:tRNA-2-methylthio-N6-dimethylallyladenosine synthase